MKGLALVIALVIASAAPSWAEELPEGRYTIKCWEGGKLTVNRKDLTLVSYSASGILIVKIKNTRDKFVMLVGGGQCALALQRG